MAKTNYVGTESCAEMIIRLECAGEEVKTDRRSADWPTRRRWRKEVENELGCTCWIVRPSSADVEYASQNSADCGLKPG